MCISPITLTGENRTVPCGRCFKCLKMRRKEWSLRLEQELKVSKTAYFITLTYAEKGIISLCKDDAKLFIKALRNQTKIKGIKYYMVGEYGERTFRPHYHALIFNISNNVDLATIQIAKAWNKGLIHVGNVNAKSINYTTKYMIQKYSTLLDTLPQPPFTLMSKGLGLGYIGQKIDGELVLNQRGTWHQENVNNNFMTKEGGKKTILPRYYREKLYTSEVREIQNQIADKKRMERLRALEDSPQEYKNRFDSIENEKRQLEKSLKFNSKI